MLQLCERARLQPTQHKPQPSHPELSRTIRQRIVPRGRGDLELESCFQADSLDACTYNRGLPLQADAVGVPNTGAVIRQW